MKIKLDENLPESLLARLTELGHQADNVRLEAARRETRPDRLAGGAAERKIFSSRRIWIFRTFDGSLPERIMV